MKHDFRIKRGNVVHRCGSETPIPPLPPLRYAPVGAPPQGVLCVPQQKSIGPLSGAINVSSYRKVFALLCVANHTVAEGTLFRNFGGYGGQGPTAAFPPSLRPQHEMMMARSKPGPLPADKQVGWLDSPTPTSQVRSARTWCVACTLLLVFERSRAVCT